MSEATLIRSEATILRDGLERLDSGEQVVLVTVASTWGSSPRPKGSVMILTETGYVAGSVSGGCIEEELFALINADFPKESSVLEYDADTTKSLPCGGKLVLLIEPLNTIDNLEGLVQAFNDGQRLERVVDVSSSRSTWKRKPTQEDFFSDEDLFVITYDAAWRVLIVGFGDLGRQVSSFAKMLDYKVSICEPREEYRHLDNVSSVLVNSAYPDDFIREAECDEQTAILALTHDPKVDDLAMLQAIETKSFYIGALGSKRTAEKRKQRLIEHFGFSLSQVSRIRGPIGLDLRTRKVNEIALAVMTDVTACRNEVRIGTHRI